MYVTAAESFQGKTVSKYYKKTRRNIVLKFK